MSRKKALVAFFFFMAPLLAGPIVLPSPDFSEMIGYDVGIRPYRSQGIRLEKEKIGEKWIIHNYGHGGAGISLSWGTASAAFQMLEMTPQESGPIAIIGSGVVGLTLAHTLLDQGYEVHIYAKEFPPHTTSDIATGTIGTYLVESKYHPEQFAYVRDTSFAKIHSLIHDTEPEFKGFSLVDGYLLSIDRYPEYPLVEIQLGNGECRLARHIQERFVETPIYMEDLFQKAIEKGAKIEKKAFFSLQDLSTLPETVIFNCTGFGAKDLCKDPHMIPVRGQIVYVRAEEEIPYMLFTEFSGENTFCFITPRFSKGAYFIGGSREEGEENLEPVQKMLEEIFDQARDHYKNID